MNHATNDIKKNIPKLEPSDGYPMLFENKVCLYEK